MSMNERVYDLGVSLARPLLHVAAPFAPKLRRGLQGRRGARERLVGWARTHRDAARPLVWFHAPSVGESLMAQAIIAELRAQRPDLQFVFTYFSPSATRIAESMGADVQDFMP